MRYCLAALILLALPALLSAQPLPVRTGEHAGFTRVVVPLPEPVSWDFGRDAGGYLLRLPLRDGFALARFFDLIPKTRITAVAQDPALGSLHLAVSCACRATVFMAEGNRLVIDIADGLPAPGSPFEAVIGSRAPPDPGPGLLPVTLPRPAVPPPLPFAADMVPPPQMPAAEPDPAALAALERRIAESLGRGLSAGVLAADPAPLVRSPRRLSMPEPALSLPGIAIRDAMDRPPGPHDSDPAVTADGAACVPDRYVDLPSWADERPFHDQLAARRARLIQDLDRFDLQGIGDLARLYLHFGFGREAVQVLALDRRNAREWQSLRLLAAIIDEDPVAFAGLDRQASCPGPIALWSFLAAPLAALPDPIDRNAILRSFKDLPVPLQRHLGPRLAERFIATGDDDAAQQALQAATLTPSPAVPARLAHASLARRQGDAAAALQTLSDLADSDPRLPPEAMIRYLTDMAEARQPVPEAQMILADALRFEHAQTPVAGDLAAAQIQASLAMDDFAKAAAVLQEDSAALGPTRLASARTAYGLAASARMADADFLDFAFAAPPPEAAPDLAQQIATRLMDLGFPDRALQFLAAAGPAPPGDERLYLQSRALLDLRDPGAVIALLRDDPSARAQSLQQAARALRAGHSAALADLTTPDSLQSRWRSGDWASLAQSDDALINQAAAAFLNRDAPGFDPARPLASGRTLLAEAAQARDLVAGLLARFAPPAAF